MHGDSFRMDVMEECFYNQDVQEMLDREMAALESDRVILWVTMANREVNREDDDSSYAPGNIQRVIHSAKRQFPTDPSAPSGMHPNEVLTTIHGLLDRLIVVQGEDELSVEA